MKISLVYISLSGNTASFIKRLSAFLQERHEDAEIEQVDIKDMVKEERPFYAMSQFFVAFLPTYLEGGNGLDNGDVEILTNDLGDFIAFEENYKRCFGIVGSGNRNFNNQYCLTAKQYAERFGFPVLDTFELRGLNEDVKRIGLKIEELYGM
ncbi:putative ribonucleotide reduction protein [Streptococcus anginosus]|uniref:Class Ib ribonucleoside-diphosphate reductase assembly flavoprotein NrdI n=2 Tax=Streptococcus anginosus TaxID=1328 RepID=A0ACC7PSL5_STRAP|nr:MULTISPECIES: class Ib ribonucleoside-diphosphate reductase assembly flavoprotein NrdI [Streptococcus]AGU82461.1 putative ribonucleotide reduction protein [Streptococcus anginosus C1051]ALL03932.1 Ribonucleotide reduction protein NrdI [Streptococcus anginosus]MCW1035058.1 class Ib ribonucleoside-diphosphate reductase assembly flavoprotein NrdI [Streptococcus anginosus]MDU6600243.1 class Ib ribonucleoside-diphosphate reductase assembly flavoprotein NrdI [Streptococcus anginosus]MDX5040798.1 